jgi:hypothetical protein
MYTVLYQSLSLSPSHAPCGTAYVHSCHSPFGAGISSPYVLVLSSNIYQTGGVVSDGVSVINARSWSKRKSITLSRFWIWCLSFNVTIPSCDHTQYVVRGNFVVSIFLSPLFFSLSFSLFYVDHNRFSVFEMRTILWG